MGNPTKLHIQTTSGTDSMGNTQVCLDSLGFNEVDVSTFCITYSPKYDYLIIVSFKYSFQYAPTVLQTIQNADGTVSIIQMDSSNPIITLPDGTTAQVQGVATVS